MSCSKRADVSDIIVSDNILKLRLVNFQDSLLPYLLYWPLSLAMLLLQMLLLIFKALFYLLLKIFGYNYYFLFYYSLGLVTLILLVLKKEWGL